jgi:hypothetical protein
MLFVIPAEFVELQRHLQEYQVLRYEPPAAVKQRYKDGGVAIIEQIICSHARYQMCYISVSQPPGSGINYTGLREVLLEFVILVF